MMKPASPCRDVLILQGNRGKIKMIPSSLSEQRSHQILVVHALRHNGNDSVFLAVLTRVERVSKVVIGFFTRRLVCRRCGVYVGAVCETVTGLRAVVNVNCLADRAAFTQIPSARDYDDETTEARLSRRASTWMPATVRR